MKTYDIRLIAMDMDGTLLNSSQRVSEGNARALRAAQQAGIHLAICSGRSPGDIGMFALENGLQDCALLALNGTHCLLEAGGEAFSSHVLRSDTLSQTIAILQRAHLSFCCFAQNRLVFFLEGETREENFWVSHSNGPLAPAFLYGEEGLETVMDKGVNKLICLAQDDDALQRVREELEKVDGLDVTSSWPLDLELMPAGYGKGSAVSELAQKLGLDASQVMTLGDYENDESMIAYAGLGVAMGNASPAILRTANAVTLTNDEDGVAHAIYRYALCTAND